MGEAIGGEWANGRTGETANGEARIRTAGSMRSSVSCVKTNGLDSCGVAASPIRRCAVSPTRLNAPGSWILTPGSFERLTFSSKTIN
jgi:hypothetical protein